MMITLSPWNGGLLACLVTTCGLIRVATGRVERNSRMRSRTLLVILAIRFFTGAKVSEESPALLPARRC